MKGLMIKSVILVSVVLASCMSAHAQDGAGDNEPSYDPGTSSVTMPHSNAAVTVPVREIDKTEFYEGLSASGQTLEPHHQNLYWGARCALNYRGESKIRSYHSFFGGTVFDPENFNAYFCFTRVTTTLRIRTDSSCVISVSALTKCFSLY